MEVNFEDLNELLSRTRRLERLTFFCPHFIGDIAGVKWPRSLTDLDLSGFSRSISGVEWPSNLQVLDLQCWRGVLCGVRFSDSLERLTIKGFSDDFPLQGVVHWDSVKFLSMVYFNEEMYGSVQFQWPVGLEVLFLEKFRNPIYDVKWPSTLKHLYFGDWWNESIVGVTFPPSLEILELGHNFSRTLRGVLFPSSLKILSLGSFDLSLDGVVFPDSLEELQMGFSFCHPLDVYVWPSSLRKLYLPAPFHHTLDEVPAGVEVVVS